MYMSIIQNNDLSIKNDIKKILKYKYNQIIPFWYYKIL